MEIQAISSVTPVQSQSASESTTTTQAAPQKAGGPPPAGGTNPTSTSESSSDSATAKIYDKRDTNQDGIVSYEEELLYALTHLTEETQKQSTASISQTQAGLNAYQQSGQTGTQSQNSTSA